MLLRRNGVDVLALFWILIISAFLIGNLSNAPLWQDEAESALNALTISPANLIPKGSVDGNTALLHEMALYYKTDDPKYEYLPTHYLETTYVTIHGWLPYYFIRVGIGIFGKNEFGPRFFPVVFFGLTLATLYWMVRQCSNPSLALCVMAYCSLMPTMLGYAMQARYYSYALFFNLFGVFSFCRFLRTQSRAHFWIWVASEVMLYYTYISAFLLHQVVFALFLLISRRDLLKSYILQALFVGLSALPHLLVTKFPLLALKLPARHSVDIASFQMAYTALERNPLLALSAVAFLVVFIVRTVKNTRWRGSTETGWDFEFLTFLIVCVGYPLLSYTSPEASFYPRVFLPVVPFVIFAAFFHISPERDGNWPIKALRTVTFSCIVLFLFFNPSLKYTAKAPDLFALKFKPNQVQTTDSKWVFDALTYIGSTGVKNPLILTSFEHFVFAYYSDYRVELIWPLRTEYIDGLEGDFFIVTEDSDLLRDHCAIFLPEEKMSCRQERTMKFFDRAAMCTRVDLGKIRIYQHLGG